ncbi:MAG: hypothetical protein JWO54_536 [Candidatus Saccharibacteria bacterium]|nr:hypothetical protein [Candidatus Saccharibacteria bacterium]
MLYHFNELEHGICYSKAMSTELFDIIDRQDYIIGTTDRQTAHTEGLLHRVAAVFIFQ